MSATVRRLVALCLTSHGTAAAVAEQLGVTRQRLCAWASGARPTPLRRLAHLARLAHVPQEEAVAAYAVERLAGTAGDPWRKCNACPERGQFAWLNAKDKHARKRG